MPDLLRDSSFGQCLRFLSGNRLAKFPEELPDFKVPYKYIAVSVCQQSSEIHDDTPRQTSNDRTNNDLDYAANQEPTHHSQQYALEKGNQTPNASSNQHAVIVDWYSDDDPDNPHNWSGIKKGWSSVVILLYTFTVYIGSSLYTASEEDVTRIFGVSDIAASVNLSIYVIGYSVAPLFWSPLSEIPAIGRNLPYVTTFFLFVVLCVPTALVSNFGGLLVLRFLLGFFGSPALATGGASYGDFYGAIQMPYVLAFWGGGATLGPALGPVVGDFAVQSKNWRWSSWELLWLSGPAFLLVFFTLPETSSDLILRQRAQRLRKLTGRTDIIAESEIRQANITGPGHVAFRALIKPAEINIKDPAMLFTTIYTAWIYGIYYSFFESFPIVYGHIYGWNLGERGLAFLAVLVGLITAVVLYCAYFFFLGDRQMAHMEAEEPGSTPPEARLKPGLVATFCIPLGLYTFAWTARTSIFWVVSLLGVAISMLGVFIITQCMFIYLPFTYPKYAGSLFAANGFARGAFAAGAILFARPMFQRLGVGGGVSLLGGLTVLCIPGIYILYFYGHRLRERSKFAES